MVDIRVMRGNELLYTAEVPFVPRVGEDICIPSPDGAQRDDYNLKVTNVEWMASPTGTDPDTDKSPTGNLDRCYLFVAPVLFPGLRRVLGRMPHHMRPSPSPDYRSD